MQKNGEQFDAVMCDPPKFVMTREPAGAAEGMRKYSDLNQIAASLVKPGGLLVTCSCSGWCRWRPLRSASSRAPTGSTAPAVLRPHRPGVDHPVYSNCLESRYLKVLWARVV